MVVFSRICTKYLNLDFNTIQKRSILKKGDVLFNLVGASIGRAAIFNLDKISNINQAVAIIRLKETLNNKYLSFFLNSEVAKHKYLSNIVDVARANISLTDTANIEIPLPPLPEQIAIVNKIEELFSELENGKEQLLTAQRQLKIYRQSLLKAAFEGKLSRDSEKKSELGFVGLKDDRITKESNNNDILKSYNPTNPNTDKDLPEGWKWVKLGDVIENVEYGSSAKSKESGKIPVLRMGNIQKGIFDWNDLVYTNDEQEIKKYLLKKNDVLFNRTNSAELVGKTAIYKGERLAIFAGYLIRINRIEKLINANYLTYYLNTHAAKQYGNTVRSFGVNQSNINGTKLKTYPIPLPPLLVQQAIVEILESKLTVCDKLEETISHSLEQTEMLRQSILKKAFEGRLV